MSSEIRYLNIYVSEVAEQNQNGEPAGMYDVIGKSGVEYRPAFEQLKLILDCIPGGLATFEISAAGVTSQYISDGIYELSGYTKWEEHSTDSTDALKYVYEEDLPALKEQIVSLVQTVQSMLHAVYTTATEGIVIICETLLTDGWIH